MKLAQVIIVCIWLDAVWSKLEQPEQSKRGIFDSDFGLGYNAFNGGGKLIQLAGNVDATKISPAITQQKISSTLPIQFPYPIPYNYPTLSNTYPIHLPQFFALHKPFMYRPFHYTVPQPSPYTVPIPKPYPFDISPYLYSVRQHLSFPNLTPIPDIPPNRNDFYNSFTTPFDTNNFNPFFENPGTVYPDNTPALTAHVAPPVTQPPPSVGATASGSSTSVAAVPSAATASASRAVASSATVAGSSQSVASSSSSSQSKAST